MIVELFKAEHMAALDLQEGGEFLGANMTPGQATVLENDYTFTGMHDGRVIVVGGLAEQWQGRALLWSYMDKDARNHMLAIHRATLRVIESYEGARIEADVDVDFAPGHRWIQMLGFELETPRMRKYRPDGGDMARYVRIK